MSSLDASLDKVNGRNVPAFFLGCLFLAAVNAMASSSFLQILFSRLRESLFSEEIVDSEKVSTDSSVSSYSGESRALVFLLSFSFASASITLFASVLSFSSGTACAFVVAWGGITSQLGRVMGLIILFLELHRLGIRRWESVSFISLLFTGTVLVFVDHALATGVTVQLEGSGMLLCDRKHFRPTALASSLVYIILEGYLIGRFWLLLVPSFLKLEHRIAGLKDYRMGRGVALLLFDVLTIVPAVVETNLMAELLPLSIGSIIVIWSFRVQAVAPGGSTVTSIMSVPRSVSGPGTMRQSVAPTVYSAEGLYGKPTLPYHPFSSKSLNDPMLEGIDWPIARTARSSRTIDTVSASSIREAIVQVAKRAAHPFSKELDQFPVPPMTSPRAATRVITSHAAVAAKLELETRMPPKAVARPRLMVITSSDTWQADDSVLRPLMHKSPLFRLTPNFVPGSHFSMSSSESHSGTTGSRSSKSGLSSPGMSVTPFGTRWDKTLTTSTFGAVGS